MIPRTNPAVARPDGLPYANVDFFLPLTPKMIPKISQASRTKLSPAAQQKTIPQQPRTKAVIEKPHPSFGFLG